MRAEGGEQASRWRDVIWRPGVLYGVARRSARGSVQDNAYRISCSSYSRIPPGQLRRLVAILSFPTWLRNSASNAYTGPAPVYFSLSSWIVSLHFNFIRCLDFIPFHVEPRRYSSRPSDLRYAFSSWLISKWISSVDTLSSVGFVRGKRLRERSLRILSFGFVWKLF